MQAVINYLKRNQSRATTELCEYVRFPSVSAQPRHRPDLRACAQWVAKHCRQIGLQARLCPTAGNPVVVARTPRPRTRGGRRPHFAVYGRGTSDNKGQNLAHLKAVEAYLRTGTPLPCDITFVIEGEEEVGSRSLAAFLRAHRAELACDAVVISDTGMPSLKHPALTYALRGIAGFEVTLHGPVRDLHSGIFGGTVDNPALALCQLLGKLRDAKGRITVPGFYDGVQPLSAYERRQFARVPFNARDYRTLLGVPQLFGEHGFTPLEQRSARPTFEINGLTSGYQGEGSKTIVPAWARAKITVRLVPDQDPDHIVRCVRRHVAKLCPPTVRLEIRGGHGAAPYLVSPTGAQAKAALRALKLAFGREPVLIREGGSIPIVNEFKRILRADALLLGLALPDDNAHSPNEKFDLGCFAKGQLMSAHLWQELTRR